MVEAAAVELVSLSKVYGSKRALSGATLSVGRGEIFGYAGPNGAGKTTTIKILAGLLKPTSGTARILGHDIVREPLLAKSKLGFVPESGAVFERFSPSEYLGLVAALHGLAPEVAAERVDSWLARFRLGGDRDKSMTALSKGTRQKVCWIGALLHEPEVLVLDEPLNGLDVESVALARDLMTQFAAEGRTVFYSSHLIDIVARVCTGVAVIHRGRILAAGPVDEVTASLGGATLEGVLLGLAAQADGA